MSKNNFNSRGFMQFIFNIFMLAVIAFLIFQVIEENKVEKAKINELKLQAEQAEVWRDRYLTLSMAINEGPPPYHTVTVPQPNLEFTLKRLEEIRKLAFSGMKEWKDMTPEEVKSYHENVD